MQGAERYEGPIRDFVVAELLDGAGDDLTSQTPLLEWGILDSFSIPRLVAFLDERFGVQVPDDELSPADFASIEAIAAVVARVRGG